MVSRTFALKWFRDLFTIYTTTRVVRIRSKVLATLYVTLVILVWCAYFRSYDFDLRRIYQERCPAKGNFLCKVKGVLTTENYRDSDLAVPNPKLYKRIWDTEDTVVPSADGFFVLTNLLITPNQTRGVCSDETNKYTSHYCRNAKDCPVGKGNNGETGVFTGNCTNIKNGGCLVSAWCPNEKNILPFNGKRALLEATANFTVLIKNSVEFPDCESHDDCSDLADCDRLQYRRRNILANFTDNYLRHCIYDPNIDPYCPIFRIGDIVRRSGANYSEVAVTGGVFRVRITWNCDFDWGSTIRDCLPKYSFARMDASDSNVSPGFNFRSASFHEEDRRTLTKNYGLKIIVEVNGEGKKFDFSLFILTIGASIGLFALAPLICDFLFDIFCFMGTWGGCFEKVFHKFSEEIRYQKSDYEVPALPSKARALDSELKPEPGITLTQLNAIEK